MIGAIDIWASAKGNSAIKRLQVAYYSSQPLLGFEVKGVWVSSFRNGVKMMIRRLEAMRLDGAPINRVLDRYKELLEGMDGSYEYFGYKGMIMVSDHKLFNEGLIAAMRWYIYKGDTERKIRIRRFHNAHLRAMSLTRDIREEDYAKVQALHKGKVERLEYQLQADGGKYWDSRKMELLLRAGRKKRVKKG